MPHSQTAPRCKLGNEARYNKIHSMDPCLGCSYLIKVASRTQDTILNHQIIAISVVVNTVVHLHCSRIGVNL